MTTMREQLNTVPLLSFLDAYPEPTFILCSNASPQSTLAFIYGNSALHSLMLGEDDSAVLNDSTFFNVLCEENALRWLSNPTRPVPNTHHTPGGTYTIGFRPAWLPRDHVPLRLELTATPIELPLTIPAVNSASRAFVYIASSRKTAIQLLRTESASDIKRQQQANLRLSDRGSQISPVPRHRNSSRSSLSISVSHPSQASLDNSKLPSRLLYTFPWEKTSLGPRSEWCRSLTTMVQYIMAKPVPVCKHYHFSVTRGLIFLQTTLYWGWPEYV
jgi:hypothetical protein